MTLVQNEPKKIYKWSTEIKAVYLWDTKVRPALPKYRTFTISRTEKSNMSSWWTYSDDAAWLTAGDTAFDEFFWYYGCRLNTSGVETAKITQEESWWAWKLDITQLWTLTSGDNVMIAFPIRWIKMTKSWSTVTLSITDAPNADWYQYYAFTKWSNIKDVMYLWAYEMDSNYKSLSWASPKVNTTRASFRSWVASTYNDWWRHSLMTYRVRDYIKMLYMMKYWNPNSQTVIGYWYVKWSSAQTTWATNSITNATWATATWTTWRIKLFWLEDIWGNVWDLTDCCYINNNSFSVDNTNSIFQAGSYSTSRTIAPWYVKAIAWDTEHTFSSTTAWWYATTYYCCTFGGGTRDRIYYSGGNYVADPVSGSGVLSSIAMSVSSAFESVGSRLQYI